MIEWCIYFSGGLRAEKTPGVTRAPEPPKVYAYRETIITQI